MELKDLIKSRRIELNLTLKDVAAYVGVSEATLSRWESGAINNPKRNRIATLAKVLELPPSTIVGTLPEDEEKPAPESGLDELDIQIIGIIKTLSKDQKLFLLAQLQTLQATQESKE